MLGDSLAHSKLYFQLLHLRIIPLWIRETKYDLERLRDECNITISHPIPGSDHQPLLRSAGQVGRNWDQLLYHFHVLESELARRIEEKTDEIRGLRDGVSARSPRPLALTDFVLQSFSTQAVCWKRIRRRR
jgi:hypothetical protein